jgi:hypothetical protein
MFQLAWISSKVSMFKSALLWWGMSLSKEATLYRISQLISQSSSRYNCNWSHCPNYSLPTISLCFRLQLSAHSEASTKVRFSFWAANLHPKQAHITKVTFRMCSRNTSPTLLAANISTDSSIPRDSAVAIFEGTTPFL